jgi:hypothetical protein
VLFEIGWEGSDMAGEDLLVVLAVSIDNSYQ